LVILWVKGMTAKRISNEELVRTSHCILSFFVVVPNKDDYLGLIQLTQAMNSQYSNRTEVQKIAQSTLRKLGITNPLRQFRIHFTRRMSSLIPVDQILSLRFFVSELAAWSICLYFLQTLPRGTYISTIMDFVIGLVIDSQ
jgi:hypothetical protein